MGGLGSAADTRLVPVHGREEWQRTPCLQSRTSNGEPGDSVQPCTTLHPFLVLGELQNVLAPALPVFPLTLPSGNRASPICMSAVKILPEWAVPSGSASCPPGIGHHGISLWRSPSALLAGWAPHHCPASQARVQVGQSSSAPDGAWTSVSHTGMADLLCREFQKS